jgi:hypothetical protein
MFDHVNDSKIHDRVFINKNTPISGLKAPGDAHEQGSSLSFCSRTNISRVDKKEVYFKERVNEEQSRGQSECEVSIQGPKLKSKKENCKGNPVRKKIMKKRMNWGSESEDEWYSDYEDEQELNSEEEYEQIVKFNINEKAISNEMPKDYHLSSVKARNSINEERRDSYENVKIPNLDMNDDEEEEINCFGMFCDTDLEKVKIALEAATKFPNKCTGKVIIWKEDFTQREWMRWNFFLEKEGSSREEKALNLWSGRSLNSIMIIEKVNWSRLENLINAKKRIIDFALEWDIEMVCDLIKMKEGKIVVQDISEEFGVKIASDLEALTTTAPKHEFDYGKLIQGKKAGSSNTNFNVLKFKPGRFEALKEIRKSIQEVGVELFKTKRGRSIQNFQNVMRKSYTENVLRMVDMEDQEEDQEEEEDSEDEDKKVWLDEEWESELEEVIDTWKYLQRKLSSYEKKRVIEYFNKKKVDGGNRTFSRDLKNSQISGKDDQGGNKTFSRENELNLQTQKKSQDLDQNQDGERESGETARENHEDEVWKKVEKQSCINGKSLVVDDYTIEIIVENDKNPRFCLGTPHPKYIVRRNSRMLNSFWTYIGETIHCHKCGKEKLAQDIIKKWSVVKCESCDNCGKIKKVNGISYIEIGNLPLPKKEEIIEQKEVGKVDWNMKMQTRMDKPKFEAGSKMVCMACGNISKICNEIKWGDDCECPCCPNINKIYMGKGIPTIEKNTERFKILRGDDDYSSDEEDLEEIKARSWTNEREKKLADSYWKAKKEIDEQKKNMEKQLEDLEKERHQKYEDALKKLDMCDKKEFWFKFDMGTISGSIFAFQDTLEYKLRERDDISRYIYVQKVRKQFRNICGMEQTVNILGKMWRDVRAECMKFINGEKLMEIIGAVCFHVLIQEHEKNVDKRWRETKGRKGTDRDDIEAFLNAAFAWSNWIIRGGKASELSQSMMEYNNKLIELGVMKVNIVEPLMEICKRRNYEERQKSIQDQLKSQGCWLKQLYPEIMEKVWHGSNVLIRGKEIIEEKYPHFVAPLGTKIKKIKVRKAMKRRKKRLKKKDKDLLDKKPPEKESFEDEDGRLIPRLAKKIAKEEYATTVCNPFLKLPERKKYVSRDPEKLFVYKKVLEGISIVLLKFFREESIYNEENFVYNNTLDEKPCDENELFSVDCSKEKVVGEVKRTSEENLIVDHNHLMTKENPPKSKEGWQLIPTEKISEDKSHFEFQSSEKGGITIKWKECDQKKDLPKQNCPTEEKVDLLLRNLEEKMLKRISNLERTNDLLKTRIKELKRGLVYEGNKRRRGLNQVWFDIGYHFRIIKNMYKNEEEDIHNDPEEDVSDYLELGGDEEAEEWFEGKYQYESNEGMFRPLQPDLQAHGDT